MGGIKVTKSSNFDKNLDYKNKSKIIEKNSFKASEVLRDTANSIAPIDTGKLRQSSKNEKNGNDFTLSWNVDYAYERYFKNSKNPQTTRWCDKAFDRKKSVLLKIQQEGMLQ